MKKFILLFSVAFGLTITGCGSDEPETDSGNGNNSGSTVITIPDAPEKEGMTVRGYVMSDKGPLENVVISDGVEVTKTDATGAYYLPSAKENGYVFMSIPAGYEVPVEKNTPQFWKKTAKKANQDEVINFTVTKADQSKVALMTFADFHLAKRNSDIAQFTNLCIDANNTANKLKNEGYAVYGISLGDESWDLYWYDNSYAYSNAYMEIERLKMPFFHNMGNHDNNPYYAEDRAAEKSFRSKAGPTFYSFNAGETHVILLDNIEYKNVGGAIGKIGDRSYDVAFADDIMAWLKKDLETIDDKSKPIVLGMHAQFYKLARSVGATQAIYPTNGKQLLDMLAPFSNVTLLTGHIHENCNTPLAAGNGMEHNVAAVCATWWWTGHLGGSHICKDGSPGGYAVFQFEGAAKPKWYYKGMGHDESYQFRTYDMNTVYIDPKDYSNQTLLKEWANGYDTKPATTNKVRINVFNYDPEWKVSVTENGKELAVKQIASTDPLHTLSYNCQRVIKGNTPTSSFKTTTNAHMFEATASSPTSTLTIKVTDRFGNIYTEEMKRPKAFERTMK